jgi:type I restriction enzyme M protein
MTVQTHQQLAGFIWNICNLLRGPYKRNEYRKVILPLTALRRFDCILAPAKDKVLEKYEKVKEQKSLIRRPRNAAIDGCDVFVVMWSKVSV